jgi:adenosylcobinamide kinase/adenosylcobinamide-phosphate guanylyltransferase
MSDTNEKKGGDASPPLRKLVVGGCRSGKSRYAEQWVADNFVDRIFVATLERRGDAEMDRRIVLHRASRGEGWQTIEEPLSLSGLLADQERPGRIFLVDCLTMWLSNMLLRDMSDAEIEAEVRRLAATATGLAASLVLVANEVGLGIVPESSLGRRFRDLAGWTNQQMAEVCGQVVFVAAGLPIRLKG